MIADDKARAETIEGAETIDKQEGSPHGVLLLHGFGDTPQTLRLLAEHLRSDGYDVRVPLLPGHGRNVEAFMRSNRSDWLECARAELETMSSSHSEVSVGGLSMGGALAAIVAAENPHLSSAVLISPYLNMPLPHRIACSMHWLWGQTPKKSTSPRSILNPEERAKNLGYGVYTSRLLYELSRLASEARRSLARIRVPTLIIQSRADPRIAPRVAEDALRRLGTKKKRLVWSEGGGHIITVDYGRERVFEETSAWITAHAQKQMTAR
jgi:carboxylesterase